MKIRFFASAFIMVWAGCVFEQDFYVSPAGSDLANGTKNAPFATLEWAKQAVRRKNAGFRPL